MKVFVVTRGEYSDSQIDRVFVGEEQRLNAEAYVSMKNKTCRYRGKYNVEEFDSTDANYREYKTKNYWIAEYRPSYFDKSGIISTDECLNCDLDAENLSSKFEFPTPEQVLDARQRYDKDVAAGCVPSPTTTFDGIYFSVVSYKSEEHAKKKLYDYRAKMKALYEGI